MDFGQVNLKIKEETREYLEHLSLHIEKDIPETEFNRIIEILEQNNKVSEVLDSEGFKELTRRQKEQIAPVRLGLLYCIDGRIPGILLGGRFASHWEVPAAELALEKRISDGEMLPESNELCEALRKIAASDEELLEIVMAHTSLLHPDHGCGAMAAKKKSGEVPLESFLEDENLKIIKKKTIPAMTTIYNEFRKHNGKEEVKSISVSALYDTDTLGTVFNYEGRDQGKALFISELTKENAQEIQRLYGDLKIGCYEERFADLDNLTKFGEDIYKVRKGLSEGEEFEDLRLKIQDFINTTYTDLSENQKRALQIFILRNIALQYLAGSFDAKDEHAFSSHDEDYMAVSTRGMVIGKFDPEAQVFGSTPSDSETAISFIKTKISIMKSTAHDKDPFLLFVCNPVNPHDLEAGNIQLHKVMDANAEVFRAIIQDSELGQLVLGGRLLPISVLIDEDSRAVLKVIDHSAYV